MACAKHIVRHAKATRTEPAGLSRMARFKRFAHRTVLNKKALKIGATGAALGLSAYGGYRAYKNGTLGRWASNAKQYGQTFAQGFRDGRAGR